MKDIDQEKRELTNRPGQKRWFAVEVPSARVGGRRKTNYNYVYASDAVDAFEKARKMGGWRRHLRGKDSFPNISPLTDEDGDALEEKIRNTPNVGMKKAKTFGYYGKRREG